MTTQQAERNRMPWRQLRSRVPGVLFIDKIFSPFWTAEKQSRKRENLLFFGMIRLKNNSLSWKNIRLTSRTVENQTMNAKRLKMTLKMKNK